MEKLKSYVTELQNHQGFKKYFKNTFLLLTEKLFRIVLSFGIGIWVARYLGPKEFGIFSYAISLIGLLSIFVTLGLESIFVKEIIKTPNLKGELLFTSFVIKFVGFIFCLLIIWIFIIFNDEGYYLNSLIAILSASLIFQTLNVFDYYFQSKVLSKYVVKSNFISLTITSLIKIYLLINNYALISFIIVVVVENLLFAISLSVYFLKQSVLSEFNFQFKGDLALKLLKDSSPLIVAAISVSIYMRIDQIMIKEILNETEVGYYSIVVRISEIWNFIPVILMNSLFPSLINASKISSNLLKSRIQSLYKLLFYISILIAITITIFSDYIISTLFGIDYLPSSEILKIHIWSCIFIFIGVATSKFLIVKNLQIYFTFNYIIAASLNIVLNYVLLNKFGAIGATYSTLISYLFASYLGLFFWKKTRKHFYEITVSLTLKNYAKKLF